MTTMLIIFKNGVEVKKEKRVSPLAFQKAREMTIKAVNLPENPTTDFKDINGDCFTFRKGKDNYMVMFDIL